MEKKDISQIALERIRESGIKPISKNVFNLKRVLFWSLVGFSIIVGVVSFSVTLNTLFNNDWYLYNKFGLHFILKSLPYFWVGCLLLVAILGKFYYRKTSLGYRHRTITVIGTYIILTVILGTVLYECGVGDAVEQSLSKNVPIYHIVIFNRSEFWLHPEEGLLSGRIIEVEDNVIKLIDANGNTWGVDISNAFVDRQIKIEVGQIIKIVGDINNEIDKIFTAEEIHP